MSGDERCTYFMVDVEATGPVPGLYSMVSLGATAIAPRDDGALAVGETFYAELRPVFAGVDPRANAIHGLDLERLRREGLEPRTALERLSAFVAEHTVAGTEPTFVAHVAVFDWMYVCWYYAWCGLDNPFGYKAIDTKALAMGVLGLPWLDTSKDVLVERLGIAAQDPATAHRADADARHQAELFVALMNRAGLK
ncbi:MAG: 3'-5' exonuclease [Acidobacteria bacterium]|nr:MAG: 3'-5' exonuclease [Acidobacteriota bacterium]